MRGEDSTERTMQRRSVLAGLGNLITLPAIMKDTKPDTGEPAMEKHKTTLPSGHDVWVSLIGEFDQLLVCDELLYKAWDEVEWRELLSADEKGFVVETKILSAGANGVPPTADDFALITSSGDELSPLRSTTAADWMRAPGVDVPSYWSISDPLHDSISERLAFALPADDSAAELRYLGDDGGFSVEVTYR